MRLEQLLTPQRPEHSPALLSGAEVYTTSRFRELIARVSGVLRQHGVGEGDRIVIAAPKSPAMVASVFACLNARVVFVPLDVQAPPSRLRRMIADCAPKAILTDSQVWEKLGSDGTPAPECLALSLRDGAAEVLSPARAASVPPPRSGGLAYIMYTSGSTGRPKGVTVSRDALASFLAASAARGAYTSSTRFLSFFPLHFDPMLMEILMPWMVGGATILYGQFLLPSDLLRAVERYEVTDLSCTPNVITLLLSPHSGVTSAGLKKLRSIWFGGEAANVEALRRFRELAPHVRLLNGYGPTETVVACSLHEVRQVDLARGSIPIGTPMPGTEFRVAADGRLSTEDGADGELWVGGAQVMSGYWGVDPSAEENHFEVVDGQRFFRTGDHVRIVDGLHEFCGRMNDMIKIRGYRVYPSEVEAVANSASWVAESCVVADPRRSHLSCIVVPRDPGLPESSFKTSLLQVLGRELPAYMVPEDIIILPELPRSVNGKVDRKRAQQIVEARA